MNIYASKLYRTSPRKQRIRAAVDNPINTELLIQLRSQLKDPEAFASLPKSTPKPERSSEARGESAFEDNSPSMRSGPSHHASAPSGGGPSLSDKYMDLEEKLGPDGQDMEFKSEEVSDVPETESSSDNKVESATNIPLSPEQSVAEQTDSISALLNAADSTTGVRYSIVKDGELWIYYADNIDLSDKIESVLMLLNAAGYSYLHFDRLVRSKHAMVFTITASALPLEPIT